MNVIVQAKIDATVIYIPLSRFPASAGIGRFNATFANDWYQGELASFITSEVLFFFSDPRSTYRTNSVTQGCAGPECVSYFFSGGMSSLRPSPYAVELPPEADAITVYNEQGVQGDYWDVHPGEATMDIAQNCHLYGNNESAFLICINSSALYQNAMIASNRLLQTSVNLL